MERHELHSGKAVVYTSLAKALHSLYKNVNKYSRSISSFVSLLPCPAERLSGELGYTANAMQAPGPLCDGMEHSVRVSSAISQEAFMSF